MAADQGEEGRFPAPTRCAYCKGGTLPPPSSDGRTICGFCVGGKPLDTQADWDRTWGRVFAYMADGGHLGGSNQPREEA